MKKTLLLEASLGINLLLATCLTLSLIQRSNPLAVSTSEITQTSREQAGQPLPPPTALVSASSGNASIPASSPAFNQPNPLIGDSPRFVPPTTIPSTPSRPRPFPAEAPPINSSEIATDAPNQEDPSLGPATTVNASAPGNVFAFRGIRVSVAETYKAAQGGEALGVDFAPGPPMNNNASSGPSSPSNDSPGTRETATTDRDPASFDTSNTVKAPDSQIKPDPTKDSPNGFTEDEELFRLKWGWEAFDAAQREALREKGRETPN